MVGRPWRTAIAATAVLSALIGIAAGRSITDGVATALAAETIFLMMAVAGRLLSFGYGGLRRSVDRRRHLRAEAAAAKAKDVQLDRDVAELRRWGDRARAEEKVAVFDGLFSTSIDDSGPKGGSKPPRRRSRLSTSSRLGKSARPKNTVDILEFEYADVDGVVTRRRLTKWTEYRHHFEGFCDTKNDYRTFRKDRVLRWHSER